MPEKISNTFVSYFRLIFAPANTNNGRPFIGTTHPQDSQDYTDIIPDGEEILETLKDMKRNASP
jgi:hypothetical protein